MSYPIAPGGLAAILAPGRRERRLRGGAGARARGGATTRLLIVTRGEAGTPDGQPDPDFGGGRESELICAARRLGLDEVSILDGYPDGAVAGRRLRAADRRDQAWLAERRPQAVITFGPHGVTGHPDHIVVGNATRWAVERLADSGLAPNAVYVISPVFDPGGNLDLRGGAGRDPPDRHRGSPRSASSPLSSATPARRTWPGPIAALRAAIESESPITRAMRASARSCRPPTPVFDTGTCSRSMRAIPRSTWVTSDVLGDP